MSLIVSLGLIAVGGVLSGIFSLPVTRVKDWDFGHIWSMGSLAALLLLPWPLVYFFVPQVGAVYAGIPDGTLIKVVLCGIAWGVGGIFWGRAIDALGMALGVTLMMGLINVFGSIGPMSVLQPEMLKTPGGSALILALSVLIIGILLISLAGREKEKGLAPKRMDQTDPAGQNQRNKAPFAAGLMFCILSGVLSAGVNFGLLFGSPIAGQAAAQGAPEFARSFAIWSLVFTANYLVNVIYGFSLMIKNRNLVKLFSKGRSGQWLGAIFMGLAWPGGIIVYGIGVGGLGPNGAYAGFPMMLLVSILTGNIAGVINGEWKGTGRRPRMIMLLGIVVMGVAFVLLGYSNQLLSN